jgi:hypothetical protein
VFRVLASDRRVPTASAAVLVAAATALSIVAVRERAGIPNPFFALAGNYQVQQWARPELRFGTVRAEASFGHPIAFGMFLAFVLVLALGLVLHARRSAVRIAVVTAAGLLATALVATLSRGPLIVAVVGMSWYLLATLRRVPPRRVLVLAGAAAVLVVTTPVLPTIQALQAQSTGDTREARSAAYRLEVLSVALDPQQFSLLGKESKQVQGVQGALMDRTGLKSLDSEFAVVYLASGALALGALVAVAGLLIRTAARPDLDGLDRAWAIGMAACCLNFVTVALLTQESELFWAGVGVVAAPAAGRR